MTSSFDRSASQLLLEISSASSSVSSSVLNSTPPRKRRSFLSDYEDDDIVSNFNKRLTTYSMFNWLAKPSDVSARQCVRYGWVCMEKDLLQCVSCKQYLSSHLPPPADVRYFRECADHLKRAIVESHDTTCQWKSDPHSGAEENGDVWDREATLADVQTRWQSLNKSLDWRPIRLVPPMDYGLTTDQLQKVATAFDPPIDCQSVTLPLALCGWRKGTVENTVFCDGCCRTVGLWHFSNDSPLECPFSPVHESRKRRRVSTQRRRLNAVEQHQTWCVWLSEQSHLSRSFDDQSDHPPIALPRWKVAIDVICSPVQPKTTSNTSEFVLARQLLDDTIAHIEKCEQENVDDS